MRLRRLIWSLLGGVVLTLTPVSSAPQIGSLTLGLVLDRLLSKLGTLITAAQNAGSILEVGAGGQIAQAIEYAKHAYEHELDVTIAKLSPEIKKVVDDLTSQVTAVEQKTFEHMREIVDHGALIALSLPLSKTFPMVSRYSPYYVVPSISNATLLSVNGNFVHASLEGYEPSLVIGNGTAIAPVQTSTLGIVFSIPSAAIQVPGTGTNYIPATLSVPYKKKCWMVFGCDEKATFKFLLVAVPPSPGKLTFEVIKSVPGVERAHKTGALHRQHSNQDDIPDPVSNGFQWCDQPDAGWRVEVNTVHPVVTWSQGDQGPNRDWWWNGNTSNLSNACWNLTTIHHGIGTSGKVDFYLDFWQQRDVLQAQKTPSVVELKWGSTQEFQLPTSATWRATFHEFDGKDIAMLTSTNNPYLRVQTSGNSVLFVTIP
jgi:hypothetical protein